jgi:hypothetical protein
MDGVVNVVCPEPFATNVVPDEVVYQSMVQSAGGIALMFTVPVLQREPLLLLVGADTSECTNPGLPVASVIVLIQPELNVFAEVEVALPLL